MTGAPTPDPFTDRQLQAISRLVDREVTRRLSLRLAASERHRDIRLAKTVEADSQYPDTGDTFWIRFLDCAFTPLEAGSSTLSQVERTAEGDTDDAADVLAREINGEYLTEGTLVFALWQRGLSGDPDEYGEWWIQAAIGGIHWITFELTEALTTSDASASADVTGGYGPGVPADATAVTVLNLHDDVAGEYMFDGVDGRAGIAIHAGGSNYQIIQLFCVAGA